LFTASWTPPGSRTVRHAAAGGPGFTYTGLKGEADLSLGAVLRRDVLALGQGSADGVRERLLATRLASSFLHL
jgi:hypothetical protein